MSGLDGLGAIKEARSRQLSDTIRRSQQRLTPGTGVQDRKSSTFDKTIGVLAAPEEIISKAIGKITSNDSKYDFNKGIANPETQVGFADLFRDSGMPSEMAAVLGIAAAIVNPLDPLNKLQIGKFTKLGKAAQGITGSVDTLVKGSDDLWKISAARITKELDASRKAAKSGGLTPANADAAQRTIRKLEKSQRHNTELNELLGELQGRGVDVEKLRLAGSVYDQVRTGQRHLIGFGSPFSADHLRLFGAGSSPSSDTSVLGIGGPRAAALMKGISGAGSKVGKPLKEAAFKVADFLGTPAVKTQKGRDVAGLIKASTNRSGATVEEIERDLQSIYKQFIDSYGTEGAAAARNDLVSIVKALETRHSGIQEVAISALDKLITYKPLIPQGKGAVVELGGGLSDEQKLRLTPSGVEDAEIPIAINEYRTANIPGTKLGRHGEHDAKVLGRYVVVRTQDAKASVDDLANLEAMPGNRTWSRQESGGETYLVQKRHPGASRINKADDFDTVHLQNLESFAAQLAAKKKGFAALEPSDILVSPSGAVQVINPSVVADFKSGVNALDNSKVALNALAEGLGIPKGSVRDFASLKNTKTARAVPRGVSGLSFRSLDAVDVGANVRSIPAHDLLEQAVNTAGHKSIVRASYDQISATDLAKQVGDPVDFERANNIEFERKRIRDAIANGEEPMIEPIVVVKDSANLIHIKEGRDRLTAAILEGYDAVPVHAGSFVGEAMTNGFYVGKTQKMSTVWDPNVHSSAAHLEEHFGKAVATNYGLVRRSGKVEKVQHADVVVDPALQTLLDRFVSLGPQYVGKSRGIRIEGIRKILKSQLGNDRNALITMAEIAEQSPDMETFVAAFEAVLKRPGAKIKTTLDNVFRHTDGPKLLSELQKVSTSILDDLAKRGFFTPRTINDARRIKLVSDSGDLVVQVWDEATNTMRFHSNASPNAHLEKVAKNYLEQTTTAADIEPYARVMLDGVEGKRLMEVKDFVTGKHPALSEVVTPVTKFEVTPGAEKDLAKKGILIGDPDDPSKIRAALEKSHLNYGVLLKQKAIPLKASKTGKFIPGTAGQGTAIIRPEHTFFMSPSGTLVLGTKQHNVKDLIEAVFEEGPAYFEEFGVITTGKVVLSNPFGAKMSKIGIGEVKNLQDRIKTIATRFKEIGLTESTVLDIHVPFDNAVWRAMYGERVTIGNVLDDGFKLSIPDGLKNHVPDIRLFAPARVGTDAVETGVIGIEKTRLANKKLQKLFDTLADKGDELFMAQAKAGLPISYYSSWFGRNVTTGAKEALNEAWLKFPDKESTTFKHLESSLKGRVFTDLTTQEVNEVLKRLKKEGIENPEDIISQVVLSLRDGYKINPTKKLATSMVALSKALPEGLDFFYLDPIYSMAISANKAARSIGRQEIVEGLKDMKVALWSGSLKQLNEAKIGNSKAYIKLEQEIAASTNTLTETKNALKELQEATPDIKSAKVQTLKDDLDKITETLANQHTKKLDLLEGLGEGKTMDTMVDLQAEKVWIKGEDITKMIDDGRLDPNDILGDPSDAFVRVDIKKYASKLGDDAEVFLFPQEVAGAVQRYFGATTKSGFQKFLGIWDNIHSMWRSWTLFPIPAYHIRNGVSNTFMAYLGGVTDPAVYRDSHEILKLIDTHRKGGLTKIQSIEALKSIKVGSANGKVYTGQDIYDNFVANGGLSGGLHRNEFSSFGTIRRESEFSKMSVKAGIRDSSELAGSWLFDNAALRLGVGAASHIENRFRLAAFIDSLVKGKVEIGKDAVITGYQAAAMHMKRVFYDYGDMSAFERSWVRRAIPFYSWSRHNIPRMLQTMVTDPVKHFRMNQFFHQIEVGATDGNPVDERDLPDWVKDRFGIVIDMLPNGSYVVKTGDGVLPFTDGYKMFAGQGFGQMILDGITPIVKLPIEQLMNHSTFNDRPIERFAGERSNSFALNNLGFSKRMSTQGPLGVLNIVLNESLFKTFFRPGAEFTSKIIDPIFDGKEGPSFKMGVMGLMIGKAYEIDPQRTRMGMYRNWTKTQNNFKSLHSQALKNGDVNGADDVARMMNYWRLQYPGK
tara:strand:+ start:16659 stop:22814 length:6156 start_codon:yes stop_codon:yes gene_type:complete